MNKLNNKQVRLAVSLTPITPRAPDTGGDINHTWLRVQPQTLSTLVSPDKASLTVVNYFTPTIIAAGNKLCCPFRAKHSIVFSTEYCK